MEDAGTIHDRLSRIVEVFGEGKNTVFARLIQESEANIRGYRSNVVPKQPLLEKIVRKFDISPQWLLTGIGDMRRQSAGSESPRGVPYFQGGLRAFGSDDRYNTASPDTYINFPPFAAADCWTDVTGHSMEPLINPGDAVALRKMENWRTGLLSGEIYCVVTSEYSTVKRVRIPSDPERLVLEPLNRDYDAQEIPRSIVKGVWQVLGCVRRF